MEWTSPQLEEICLNCEISRLGLWNSSFMGFGSVQT